MEYLNTGIYQILQIKIHFTMKAWVHYPKQVIVKWTRVKDRFDLNLSLPEKNIPLAYYFKPTTSLTTDCNSYPDPALIN